MCGRGVLKLAVSVLPLRENARRRRGAAALVLICKRVPGKLLPCLHALCRKVIALAREGQLLWSEQALMYEYL